MAAPAKEMTAAEKKKAEADKKAAEKKAEAEKKAADKKAAADKKMAEKKAAADKKAAEQKAAQDKKVADAKAAADKKAADKAAADKAASEKKAASDKMAPRRRPLRSGMRPRCPAMAPRAAPAMAPAAPARSGDGARCRAQEVRHETDEACRWRASFLRSGRQGLDPAFFVGSFRPVSFSDTMRGERDVTTRKPALRELEQPRPVTTVATIVERNGAFLLVEEENERGRADQPAGGTPRGRRDARWPAAIRETLEETGYHVRRRRSSESIAGRRP
jgi:hypothetical protein